MKWFENTIKPEDLKTLPPIFLEFNCPPTQPVELEFSFMFDKSGHWRGTKRRTCGVCGKYVQAFKA